MNVLFFRGWLGVFSQGLNEMAAELKRRYPDVTVRVYEWDQWEKALGETKNWKDPFILVGHSYGVAAMFDFAKGTNQRVKYAIALDPSQYVWLTSKITNNIPPRGLEGYNFYQKPLNPFSIGGVTIDGFTNHRLRGVSHAGMDDDKDVQAMVLKLIEDNLG